MDVEKRPPGRSCTPSPPRRCVKFLLGEQVRKHDSVDSIMDKIDCELDSMTLRIPNRSRPAQRIRSLTRNSTLADKGSFKQVPGYTGAAKKRARSSDCSFTDTGISLSYSTPSLHYPSYHSLTNLTQGPPPIADLDLKTRIKLEETYSTILRNKTNTDKQEAPLCTFSTQTDHHMQASDSASVCTEDFEQEFCKAFHIPVGSSDKLCAAVDVASVYSEDTPRTEDFEQEYQSSLVKQVAGVTVSNFPGLDTESINSDYIKQKLGHKGTTVDDIFSASSPDTVDEMSELEYDKGKSAPKSKGHNGSCKSPGRQSGQYDGGSSESDVESDMAREIREESCRIQKEIELERKANKIRETTPKKTEHKQSNKKTPTSNGRPTSHNLPAAYNINMTQSMPSLPHIQPRIESASENMSPGDGEMIRQLNIEKRRLLQEINDLQENMRMMEEDVRNTERQAKENRAKAEEARSQLMLADFQKNSALKEFTELSEQLERGRQLQSAIKMESAQQIVVTENPQSAYGISSAELSDLLSERDQLRALLDNRTGTVQQEKDELQRSLDTSKCEQRKSKDKVDLLETRIVELTAQLGHSTTEKETKTLELDSYRSKNHKLEQQLRELDKSKLQAIMDRDKELEILRESSQRDALETRMKLSNDLNNAKKLLGLAEEKCLKLQLEIEHRDQLNHDLREECTLLQSKTVDEEESHDQIIRELNRKVSAIEEQKDRDMQLLKSQMEIEHISSVDQTRADLEQQHEEVIIAMKQDYDNQINQQQQLINGKEEEICLLRSRLTQQEEASRKLAERLKADTQLQLEQVVQNERHMWEKEHKYLEDSQLKHFKDETEKQQDQMREELESEQRRCRQLEDQYRALKSEIEEQRHQNQKLYQEKLDAVTKSKQSAQEETNLQLEKIRQQLEEDTERVLDKLRGELLEKENEIRALRNDCNCLQQSESDVSIALEKLEKLVVNEINDECRKTAHLLGVTPRKAHSSGLGRSSSPSRSGHRRTRSIAASAIANLRACNEEMRNTVKELRDDVDALKASLYKSKKAKEAELELLRKQLNRDKSHDMDDLKLRLTQKQNGRINHNYADLSPNQYLTRLERKIADNSVRRTLKDSAPMANGTIDHSDALSVDDLGASPQLRKSVQSRVKQLRNGSPTRKSSSRTTSDLSSTLDGASNAMEQRVKLAELKAHLAEERAQRNQSLLSQKLHEVNHLQHQLNSQTKDLMSLERSFEDLRHSSPPRSTLL